MSETFWEGAFKGFNKVGRWRENAAKLKRGGDLLFAAYLESCKLRDEDYALSEDAKIAGVATLLYGLATESILKAALLKQGIGKVQADGTVSWNSDGASGHDLLSMCRRLGILQLNAEQEKLLERMSAFVCWAGKYPTPMTFKNKKAFKGLLLSDQSNAGQIMLPMEFGYEDKVEFEQIYGVLWDKASGTVPRPCR